MNTVDLYNVCLIIAMDTDRNMGKWTECLIHLLSSILECHNVAHLHFLFGLPLIFFFFGGGIEFICSSYWYTEMHWKSYNRDRAMFFKINLKE